MNKTKLYPMLQALIAALLFGASAPISKIFLKSLEPVQLAAFLYLGSGIGLFIFQLFERLIVKRKNTEAPLAKKDVPWLIGAVLLGGVIAPIVQMYSLRVTPASTASLLLNFEGVATTIIAFAFFKESIGKNVWIAMLLITISSILLSWDFNSMWGLSLGALGILFSCFCWGLDNNFTRNISSKNPFLIVIIKGLGAGSFSLILSFMLKKSMPDFNIILLAMLLGCFSYGLSIVLFVLAMRNMGSARASALYGTAPFIGVILSFILLKDIPNIMFVISLPFMIAGAILLMKEEHCHKHLHEHLVHEHRHCHTDGHHNHTHDGLEIPPDKYHSHLHTHEQMEHEHPHMPDIHHRHKHAS